MINNAKSLSEKIFKKIIKKKISFSLFGLILFMMTGGIALSDNIVVNGSGATANGTNAIAVGNAANGEKKGSVAIGDHADAKGKDNDYRGNIAIGEYSAATGDGAIAIGRQSKGLGGNSTVFGSGAVGFGSGAVAIGGFNNNNDWAKTTYDITGDTAKAIQSGMTSEAIAKMNDTLDNVQDFRTFVKGTANEEATPVIIKKDNFDNDGNKKNVPKDIIETNSRSSTSTLAGRDSVALGNNMNLRETRLSIGIGTSYKVAGKYNIVMGTGSEWNKAALVRGENNIAIGSGNYVLGSKVKATEEETSSAVDWEAVGDTSRRNTILGSNNVIFNKSSDNTILGSNNNISIKNSKGTEGVNNVLLLGSNIKNADASNSVYLGSETRAFLNHGSYDSSGALVNNLVPGQADVISTGGEQRYSGIIANNKWASFAGPGKDGNGVITVGAPGKERRIQNLAAGLIGPNSTDAINGSQLYWYVGHGEKRWEITDEDGIAPLKGLVQAADKNYYNPDVILDADGMPTNGYKPVVLLDGGELYKTDSNGNKTGDPLKLISSVINPNPKGTGDNSETQEPIITGNILSGIDKDKQDIGTGHTEEDNSNKYVIALRNAKGKVLNYGVNIGDLQKLSNTPLFFKGDIGSEISRKLGETLNIQAEDFTFLNDTFLGENLKTEAENGKIKIGFKASPIFKGTVTSEKVVTEKVVVKDGGPSLTKNGIDAADKKITRVADGIDSKDAVNKGQLDEVKGAINASNALAVQNAGRIDELRRDHNNGMAQMAAMASIDFAHVKTHKLKVGAGLGGYRGTRAVAVGVAYSPTENLLINAKWSTPTHTTKGSTFGIGATYELDFD